MAKHPREHAVWFLRINGQRRDLLSIFEAQMRPRFSGVAGAVDSVAHGEIRPVQTFAAGYINNVGIGRCDCDITDRLRRLRVEDRPPGAAVVVRLPHTAIHRSYIEDVRLRGNTHRSARAPGAEGPDHTPVQVLQHPVWDLLPRV